jgi:hypothetical protein
MAQKLTTEHTEDTEEGGGNSHKKHKKHKNPKTVILSEAKNPAARSLARIALDLSPATAGSG